MSLVSSFGVQGRFYSFWKDLSRLQFALSSGLDAMIKEPELQPKLKPGAPQGRSEQTLSNGAWEMDCMVDPRPKQVHGRSQRMSRNWDGNLKGRCGEQTE